MAVSETRREMRTYGNWQRKASAGLLGLGTIGTIGLYVGLLVMLIVMATAGVLKAIPVGLAIGIAVLLLTRKDKHNLSIAEKMWTRAAWSMSRSNGSHLYRSGPLGRTAWGKNHLPGIGTTTELTEHHDAYGRPFALVESPKVGTFAVTIRSEPDGGALVDVETIDQWVAEWGSWLGGLADEPGLVGAAVTVESAPESGAALRREQERREDPDAPDFARRVMAEILNDYPTGSSNIRAFVTLTYSAAGMIEGRKIGAAEMGRELATRLPGLTAALELTGAGGCTPMPAAELCEVVRVAYDPATAVLFDRARDAGETPEISWGDVGPAAHQAAWDHYRHDSAYSMTWSMTGAPRGIVFSNVLLRLLKPQRDIARKRVTLLYQVIDAARAEGEVSKQEQATEFVATASRRTSQRQRRAVAAAHSTSQEEAMGASLVDFGLVVTATVMSHDQMPAARAAIEFASAGARLRVRPVYGSQHTAFAVGLPIGLVPSLHSATPQALRDGV